MASSSPSWAAAEHLEANPSPAILPSSMANSSGLFDGELFGDELMDIYNAAVEDAPPGGKSWLSLKQIINDDVSFFVCFCFDWKQRKHQNSFLFNHSTFHVAYLIIGILQRSLLCLFTLKASSRIRKPQELMKSTRGLELLQRQPPLMMAWELFVHPPRSTIWRIYCQLQALQLKMNRRKLQTRHR